MTHKVSIIARGLALKFAFLALFSLVATASAYATTVRGMLVRPDRSAAAYLAVTIWNQAQGRSSYAYTGTDGMYYIYNVPPGTYVLEIWLNNNNAIRYTIQVPNQPMFDISPIVVP
jgi:hypothetical protein